MERNPTIADAHSTLPDGFSGPGGLDAYPGVLLSAIFDQAAVGISVIDAEGRCLKVNERLTEMFRLPEAQLIGVRCQEVTHPDDWRRHGPQILRVLSGHRSEYTMEKRYRRPDGTYFWANVAVSPLPDHDGQSGRLVAIVEDIDDRKRAEAEVHELTRSLESRVVERTAQLETFCYSIAHDLREHIRGVTINASFAKDLLPDASPEAIGYLDRLSVSAMKMDRLVKDLLLFARTTQQDLQRTHLDLTGIAAEVAESLSACHPDAVYRIAPHLRAYGDRAAISLVFQNLLDNAAKYAHPERHPVIEVGREGQAFFVRDNGRGFDMVYATRIFQPFERLPEGQEVTGTGIGLANVRQMIEKHGGTIWVHSEPGVGSTFFFTLPF